MSAPRFTARPTYDVDPGRGRIPFAAIMLGLAGVLDVVYGLAAISGCRWRCSWST
ncbi:hypothetical protein [Candidatus Solirubrobacter pratensis]|uniref:hypothetical protein n=1 Tax=Candidatus Solirubrobacter pratensis TaxID=1298857 RepID=UPI0012DF37F5|nr:hypothetical protein [Candidatus Solirubrobacter pratensis]